MSLATSAAPGSRRTAAGSAEQLIDHRINEARSALWWAELSRNALRMLIVAIVAVLLWVIVDQWVYSPGVAVRLAAAAGLLGWIVWWLTRRVLPLLGRSIRKEYAARSIERDIPEMRQELTSYVTLQGDRDSSGLRSRVVRSIGAQAAGRLRAHDALPDEATGTLNWWIAAAAALALLAAYCVISPKNTFRSATRLIAPLASIEPARRVSIQDVRPGDAEAIAGRQVDVSASILGLNQQDEIWCRWETNAGEQQSELTFDQESGRYRGAIALAHSAAGDVAYQIEAGDATAGPFQLRVQDVPVVAVESIRYEPPGYTGEVPHTSSSASITGIDGTQVTVLASTNRNVVKANIEFNPKPLGESIRATAGAAEMKITDNGMTLSISFPLRSTRGRSAAVQLESYRVKVWDAAGQSNPDPIIYPIRVIADLPPEVSIVMPRKSPKDVPIDAQQVIEVHAMDADFGLRRVGLEIRRGIDIVAEPTLWTDPNGAKGNRVTDYRFRPAEHGLRVGDVVHITATATDNRLVENDPSIEPNVSVTDPIKIKVTASEVVSNDPAGGDGLSPPDERPASDAGAGDESKQESGEGSPSGGEGASGDGASGEGKAGESGTSGTGTSGEGKTGESGESGKSGEGGSGESESTEREGSSEGAEGTGSSTGAEAAGGESPTKGQPGQQPNGAEQPSGTETGQRSGKSPAKGSDPNDAQPAGDTPPDGGSAEPSTAESADPAAADKPSQTTDRGSDPSGQPRPDGSTGESAAEDAGNTSAGQPDPAESQSGKPESASSTEGGSKSTGGEQGADPSANQQTPKHDGEAFERIRDFLEDMKRSSRESGSGDSQSGESEEGEPGKSESGTGESETGETGKGESGKGENAKGESGQGETGQGESGQGESGQGESGQGESGQGETGQGETGQGETGQGETGQGETGQGETGQGETGQGETGQGETGQGETGESETGEGETGKGQPRPGDASNSGASKQPNNDSSQAQGQPDDSSQSPSQGGAGSGTGNDIGGKEGDAVTQPDPVDLEYTKKATDMVLDYLEQTRDEPDRDLLDRLNWTEEDLQRFTERWKEVRELDQPETSDPNGNRDVEEALRSLGLRPPTQATANNRGTADSLRGVRDAGNRKPPPPAHQDAFDAFRRAMGRQR